VESFEVGLTILPKTLELETKEGLATSAVF
jgi:hypothetical protein